MWSPVAGGPSHLPSLTQGGTGIMVVTQLGEHTFGSDNWGEHNFGNTTGGGTHFFPQIIGLTKILGRLLCLTSWDDPTLSPDKSADNYAYHIFGQTT